MNINFDSEALKDVEEALTSAYNHINDPKVPVPDTRTGDLLLKIAVALGHIQAQRAVSQVMTKK